MSPEEEEEEEKSCGPAAEEDIRRSKRRRRRLNKSLGHTHSRTAITLSLPYSCDTFVSHTQNCTTSLICPSSSSTEVGLTTLELCDPPSLLFLRRGRRRGESAVCALWGNRGEGGGWEGGGASKGEEPKLRLPLSEERGKTWKMKKE